MTQPAAIRDRSNSALAVRSGWTIVAVGLLVCAFSIAAKAQVAAPSDGKNSPTSASVEAATGEKPAEPPITVPPQIREKSGRIQYVGPDTYILLDEQGRPQPVPGMTYEDFLEAWKKSQQASKPEATPRYTLESIKFDGATRDGFAELDFVATIHLLVDGPVEVPLGLVGAILQGQPEFTSADNKTSADTATTEQRGETLEQKAPGDYLTQNPDQGGFIARLTGRAGERRRVSLKLIVPLSRDGAETTLQLSCPRAVSSNFTLTTQSPLADASVSTGTILAQKTTEQGGTRLEVAGAVGSFRLMWHSAEKGTTEFATVLSAAGAIQVSVDGRSVRSKARLTVQSYGGDFDRFRVRLPPGAQLISDPEDDAAATQAPRYRVTVEKPAPGGAGVGPADAGSVVLVEFSEKQLAPVTIELSTDQPIGLDGGGSSVELAGFEVLGAVRQFGDVGLNVANDWQARWQIGDHVRQVDTNDLEASLRQDNLTAAFQYDRQPWSLGVRIEARQTRIHVTPQYELQCLPDEARLTLRLNYQVYGARAFEFKIRMEGWQITGSPLESGGLVDLDKLLRPGDEGILTLPLAQASTPRAEIMLSLRRPIPRDQSRLELPLPVPIAESIATGNLTVRTTPDIELQPDLQNSSGLTPVAETSTTNAQGVEASALLFRTLLPDAVFVAKRLNRAQEVSADVVARIELEQSGAQVEQQFDYDVQHVPLKELVFEAPNELWLDEDQIEVVLVAETLNEEPAVGNGETPLSIVYSPEDYETTSLGDTMRFRVPLPRPGSGQFSVRLRYRVPRREDAANGLTWHLPLIRPVDVQPSLVQAQVHTTRGLAVALDAKAENSTWKSAETTAGNGKPDSSYAYVAEGIESFLPLVVTSADFNPPSATTVDRIWLQTWFSGDMRQDKAAIRFRTAALQATVELPPSAVEVEVLLDGKPADVLSRAEGRIVVRLVRTNGNGEAEDAKLADHTLELRSRLPIDRALVTRHELTPPHLVGATALSQIYWQIVLPGDEHVIRSPGRMSSASQWQWLGSFWGLHPVMSQSDLEKWVQASTQIVPTVAQNEYLYTGLSRVSPITLITAPRWLIVLISSCAVLALGLVWIYVPAVRQGWILVALAGVIAGLAVAFPIPALLLAQAAALGVIVVLLSLLLNRIMSRPTHWPVIMPSSGSSQRQAPSRTDSILMPPVVAAASTAPTVPLRISDSHQ
jgi:hypothetical protein